MSSLTTTRGPSSFQLRLAFNCRNSSPVFLRVRFRNLYHRSLRIYSVAGSNPNTSDIDNNGKGTDNGGETQPPRSSGESASTNSSSSTDGFSGWSDAEQSDGSSSNQSFAGTVGAGLAAIFLVAGLTFAALSIGKKSMSRVKQQMEPLTVLQEVSLASDDHDEQFQQRNEVTNYVSETSTQESKAGIDQNSPLYIDYNRDLEIGLGDDYDGCTSNGVEVTGNSAIQQDLQKETAEVGTSVVSEATPKHPRSDTGGFSIVTPGYSIVTPSFGNNDGTLPESKDGSFVDGTPEAPFASENPDFGDESMSSHFIVDTNMTNHIVFDVNTLNLSSDHQQAASSLQKIDDVNSLGSPTKELSSNILATESQTMHGEELSSVKEVNEQSVDMPVEHNNSSIGMHYFNKNASSQSDLLSPPSYSLVNEQGDYGHTDANVTGLSLDSNNPADVYTCAGVPAPSFVPAALQVHPRKVLVPAVVDPVQGQALAALQALKVIEADIQPGDLCTRREYARWLVSASSALSRNSLSKVYPAMYIENVTELAFDDITPEDPDFPSIQGLAEAGLISSRLSRHDFQSFIDDEQNTVYFSPESPLSRQDLVSWKMALERRQLPVINRKSMEQLSGFLDTAKIHPDAWPALAADLAAGEQGIIALAFGYTRLFQPDKPVTYAQAAVALATGEASDVVSEELARIEAEAMAEKAVAAQSDLVAQVDKNINVNFEKDLILEREKINAIEKLAEETRQELDRLKAQREEENFALMRERALVDSEMEILSRLRREVEEQLQTTMSNKVEISYEKEKLSKLREDAESENREIAQLHYELEVERKALSMARAWAEDEAKRAREQVKALEEVRGRWESQGIKVIVDDDLSEEVKAGVTWLGAGKEHSVEGTVNRAETLVDRLQSMAGAVKGRCKYTIDTITQKILNVISVLKELALKISRQAGEVNDAVLSKTRSSFKEVQQYSAKFSSTAKEGIKRIAIDCKDGLGKFTQKFKT